MERGTSDLSGLVFLGVLAALAWMLWPPLHDRVSGKLTAYPIVCQPGSPGISDCDGGRWQPWGRAVFAVVPSDQIVVIRYTDQPPARLSDCVVLDRLNWQCGYYAARDGDVEYTGTGDVVRFLPRWRWYAFKYLGIRP